MPGVDPLLEEAIAASLAMGGLAALITLLYWLLTGLSPWPFLILAEAAGFGTGIAVLSIASPRRRR